MPEVNTARLIVSFKCSRGCEYCCNKYSSIIDGGTRIKSLDEMPDYDTYCITGGEPMEWPEKTKEVINGLGIKGLFKSTKIYLYTAKYTKELTEMLPFLDGVHYTLHENSGPRDLNGFEAFQNDIRMLKRRTNKSFRLYINQSIKAWVTVQPNLWTRVESKPWIGEESCQLPAHEKLYILEED